MTNIRLLLISSILLIFTSCFKEEHFDDNLRGNFEALWTIMDEKYCFFEYKDVDWNAVHDKYAERIDERMGVEPFFNLMGEMLAEVKDGHVNLNTPFNYARYWKWYEDYPDNFREDIQRKYLETDYGIAGGLKYKLLKDNIGYIHYASFNAGLGEGNLNNVLAKFASCDGIILDVRNNGGGMLSHSEKLASHFMKEKTLVAYMLHKTGKGHNDFSKPYAIHVDPTKGIKFMKTVVVLTNRRCFSATNDFVNAMTYAPNAILVGDKTGGGSGLPFSSELPNGWTVRFSASPMLNAEKKQIEFGIEPHIHVDMAQEDMDNGIDTIIEKAREIIKNKDF